MLLAKLVDVRDRFAAGAAPGSPKLDNVGSLFAERSDRLALNPSLDFDRRSGRTRSETLGKYIRCGKYKAKDKEFFHDPKAIPDPVAHQFQNSISHFK